MKKIATELITKLEETNSVARVDSFEDLKNTIIGFFQLRTKVISKLETFRAKVETSLLEQLESGDLKFGELYSLYNMVSNQINNASDSIVSIFKPVPGAESILAKTLGEDDHKDKVEEFYNTLSPEELRKIDSFTKAVAILQANDAPSVVDKD